MVLSSALALAIIWHSVGALAKVLPYIWQCSMVKPIAMTLTMALDIDLADITAVVIFQPYREKIQIL